MPEEISKTAVRASLAKDAMSKSVPQYARLFFDHLYSEYQALKPSIHDYSVLNLLEEIHERRLKQELTWSDIYTFDLTLVDLRPPENLIRKAYDSRARYRSVAGQKEYDEYLASKPLDLGAVQFEHDSDPPKPKDLIERELRADIRYLLSKFYLYYALLPMREGLRDQMTKKAAALTGFAVLLIAIPLGMNLVGAFIPRFAPYVDQFSALVVTVLTVMLAGIIGGCVSMLQRIQSTPSDGDALFNLASLTNGWRGIMLSPLYGGIFAFMLFVLFAGNVLNGAIFPTIVTPSRSQVTSATATPAPAVSKPAPAPSSSPVAVTEATASPLAQPTSAATPSAVPVARSEPPPSGSPSPTPTPGRSAAVLDIKTFLRETGPQSGVAYALLIVWSFLAGFAERLVPDTLNRLVKKNIDSQG